MTLAQALERFGVNRLLIAHQAALVVLHADAKIVAIHDAAEMGVSSFEGLKRIIFIEKEVIAFVHVEIIKRAPVFDFVVYNPALHGLFPKLGAGERRQAKDPRHRHGRIIAANKPIGLL